jgi:hypothetical protein
MSEQRRKSVSVSKLLENRDGDDIDTPAPEKAPPVPPKLTPEQVKEYSNYLKSQGISLSAQKKTQVPEVEVLKPSTERSRAVSEDSAAQAKKGSILVRWLRKLFTRKRSKSVNALDTLNQRSGNGRFTAEKHRSIFERLRQPFSKIKKKNPKDEAVFNNKDEGPKKTRKNSKTSTAKKTNKIDMSGLLP